MKNRHRKQKHRRNRQRRTLLMQFADLDRSLQIFILTELALLGLLVTLLIFRNQIPSSLPFRLILASAISLPILFFSMYSRSKPSRFGQVINTLSVIKLVIATLMTHPRLFALGTAILLAVHAAYLIRRLFMWDWTESLLLQLALCGLEILCTFVAKSTYSYQKAVFPFWPLSLTLALILTAVLVYGVIRHEYLDLKEDPRRGLIHLACACVALLFIGGFLIELTIGNLNHALDPTPATSISSIVLDKRRSTGSGRGSTSHCYLTVTINGEPMEVEVPSSVYHNTEEGDKVTVFLGDGAFGQAYCFIE